MTRDARMATNFQKLKTNINGFVVVVVVESFEIFICMHGVHNFKAI